MSKKASKKRGKMKRGSGINEAVAFSFYCEVRSDGRLNSYSDVAKKFRSTLTHVQKIGKQNEWFVKRKKHGEQAVEVISETMGEMLARKNQEHLEQFEAIAGMGFDILKKEKVAYDNVVEEQERQMKKKEQSKTDKDKLFRMRRLASSRVMVAHQMAVDGIKGARVAMGLPTDVTKTLATNFNVTSELPSDELQKMQDNLDANFNKKNGK